MVSMCSCCAWCMIARGVYRPLMLHCLWKHGYEPEFPCFKHFLAFACLWEHGWRLRCTHNMCSLTCVSVVVCVVCKLRPCPSYNRHRDRINLVLWRSLYKGGGYKNMQWVHNSSNHSFPLLTRLISFPNHYPKPHHPNIRSMAQGKPRDRALSSTNGLLPPPFGRD